MNKTFLVALILILSGFAAPLAHAYGAIGDACDPENDFVCDPATSYCSAYTSTCVANSQMAADQQTAQTQVNQQLSTGVSSNQSQGSSQATTNNTFVPIAPIPNLTQGATADQGGLARFLNNLYIFLVGLAAAIAVVEIIWGGLEIATKDSVPMHMKGKERIEQALLGLLLVLSPVLVFSIINPQILNLSANIPPLDIHKGTTATDATQPRTLTLPTCSSVLKQNCIHKSDVVFNEGYYLTPPPGAYCFKFDLSTKEGAIAAGGADPTATPTPYYCARTQADVTQSCRIALVTYCPTSATVSGDGTTVTGACPGLASACKQY